MVIKSLDSEKRYSWSGAASRLVAEALSDWLQRSIQAVKPFYSPDIDKGAKWSNEIDDALEGTHFGIICLTPDNLKSEWIHYESGALSKTKDASIWTFLLELKPSDVKQPLGRFQHTLAEKTDVLKMLKSINAKLSEVGGEPLKDNLLEEIFSESWIKLETRLNDAKKSIKTQLSNETVLQAENIRTDNDKLDEILEILRSQQRLSNSEFDFGLREKRYTKPTVEKPVRQAILSFLPETPRKEIEYLANKINKSVTVPSIQNWNIEDSEGSVNLDIIFESSADENSLLRLIELSTREGARPIKLQFVPF